MIVMLLSRWSAPPPCLGTGHWFLLGDRVT
jgi:hypothetical protein